MKFNNDSDILKGEKFFLKPFIFFPITFFLSSQKHFNCTQQDQILYTQNRFFLVISEVTLH